MCFEKTSCPAKPSTASPPEDIGGTFESAEEFEGLAKEGEAKGAGREGRLARRKLGNVNQVVIIAEQQK